MTGQEALGLVETRGLVAAVEAADAALKASKVRLVGIKKTNPALMTVQLVGDTAAVRSAVDSARAAAERVGTVVSTHVIPRPASAVTAMQTGQAPPKARVAPKAPPKAAAKAAKIPKASAAEQTASKPASAPKPASDLASMTVRELRALARATEGLTIKGRAIARASKADLLQAFGGV